jgi:hypothetical protein
MDAQMQLYLNRILPVVGNHLQDKSMVFLNPQLTHTIAEAFSRCGVKKLTIIGAEEVIENSPMHLSYGCSYLGQKANDACFDFFRRHNEFEKNWEFVSIDSFQQLCLPSQESPIDMIVGGGSVGECQKIISFAREYKIAAIVFTVLQGREAKSFISVVDTKQGLDFSLFDDLADTPCDFFSRLDFLETADLVANIAKAILLKGTEFEREDLNNLLYEKKKNNIIRGTSSWPWHVIYGGEEFSQEMLALLNAFSFEFEYKPTKEERLMIIGCGTASLLVGEAINFCKNILLIDCKNVSTFNPVRQLYGTEEIGKVKVLSAQRILTERLGEHANGYEIAARQLKLKEEDSASVEKFHALLDEYMPTIVIVGMGQTRDDNFVATKILRDRGIKHVVSAAFPLATHYKHIVVDGKNGPCYTCLQGRLPIDNEGVAPITEEQREMFYGEGDFEEKTQPATIIETWPSAHSALRLAVQLSLPENERSDWFREKLSGGETCFVGSNVSIKNDGSYLYGIKFPGQMVTYSDGNIFTAMEGELCIDCGRNLSRGRRNEEN